MIGPRRLIEVDLPIRQISAHARREKSLRHGHISTMHIWWARRPLAACRAVVLGALLPDPVDKACPAPFRRKAAEALRFRYSGRKLDDPSELRRSLLDFIAEFSDWDNSTNVAYLDCARTLVRAALPSGQSLVVDPFGGGGAIPLESLRVGAGAWAGDYNPVAALQLKILMEYIPLFGQRLAEAVRKWGESIRGEVEAELGKFYPIEPDGSIPIAFIWARTVVCEGPGCGAEIPLLRQLWIAKKKKGHSVALVPVVDREARSVRFEIERDPLRVGEGTVKRGSAICPVCNVVTPVARVRVQAQTAQGLPVRIVAVVMSHPEEQGRRYRAVAERDIAAASAAEDEIRRREKEHEGPLSLVPDEPVPLMSGVFNAPIYGMTDWSAYFIPRQALALSAFASAVRNVHARILEHEEDVDFARAVATCLAMVVDRCADKWSSLCVWNNVGEKVEHTFGRQALPVVWDFAEANPFSTSTGNWRSAVEWVEKVILHEAAAHLALGTGGRGDARELPFPDDSVDCIVTDPPYYNAVPYADLSDFFYVWLRRTVGHLHPELFSTDLSPKDGEICQMSGWDPVRYAAKDEAFFEREMRRALIEARRVLAPGGIAVVVFAHKTTSGWEAMLRALLEASWTITGSWPLETERPGRLRAQNSAALASSVHIVCRPRTGNEIGDWRSVRAELEQRVAEWLPRLAHEGVEGADAIFACLGPALEVYSRYARVETAAGDAVPLSAPPEDLGAPAFLPAVWAAVAREALKMIFEGPEAEGFEEDARLTALWLWTLRAAESARDADGEEAIEGIDEEDKGGKKTLAGLALDYDTARLLSQALGVHIDALAKPGGIVMITKGLARLVPVTERRRALLGEGGTVPKRGDTLFDQPALMSIEFPGAPEGGTALDRIHQAMLLFADGRGEALRRLQALPGYSSDPRYRRLAQALSALYPSGSPEKRWIDGVLAAVPKR